MIFGIYKTNVSQKPEFVFFDEVRICVFFKHHYFQFAETGILLVEGSAMLHLITPCGILDDYS